jgi:ATP-dependent DNA ligase
MLVHDGVEVVLPPAPPFARCEGIVMKLHNSTYTCADRTESWVKLKPEYMDGVNDTLDVVIIGGFYGEGEVRRFNLRHRLGVCVCVSGVLV